jgi:hypothetical protein
MIDSNFRMSDAALIERLRQQLPSCRSSLQADSVRQHLDIYRLRTQYSF